MLKIYLNTVTMKSSSDLSPGLDGTRGFQRNNGRASNFTVTLHQFVI